tara:strand:+ start:1699 stop:2022 length:324 start_codon:yes stop_codon:yes gene_type:complete
MRYVTTVEAQNRVNQGLPLQDGNWLPEGSRKICEGYTMRNTNPKVSVGKRSALVYAQGKIGRIVDAEPMSTKYAKKHMDYATVMSQKSRLQKTIKKAKACIAILEED